MKKEELVSEIKRKKSFLCIGLDSDIEKIPLHLKSLADPVFEFNKQIIDATHDLCVAYKPNTAFYEANGSKGMASLEKTIGYLKKFPELFTIADAKRGDIGNTSAMYAKAFLKEMNFDAITVAPYMGSDSVKPFLLENKWVILLALTSNEGAIDFQTSELSSSPKLKVFEHVIEVSQRWASSNQLMYVVGATKAAMLKEIRKQIPDHFLLVPGVGAQGGSLKDVAENGMNKECGLLVNSSRNILFASTSENFAQKAREEALKLQAEMEHLLKKLA